MGIRKPDGLFNAYTPFLVNFASTPARFLSLVDPLLPYGFIMRVFKSYGAVDLESDSKVGRLKIETNSKHDHEVVKDIRDDNREKSGLLSPDISKTLEAMWHKIQANAEESEWQTNLGSIRETPTEEPSSPFTFTLGDDDEPLSTNEIEAPDLTQSRSRSRSRTLSEENIVLDVGKEAVSLENIQDKLQTAKNSFVSAVTDTFKAVPSLKKQPNQAYDEKLGNLIPPAPDDEFVFSVPKNQYISPYWASDETLKQFPPTRILTTIVDPCIDDCVEFSKKLDCLDVDIQLDVLGALNHGFLNFAQVNFLDFQFHEMFDQTFSNF